MRWSSSTPPVSRARQTRHAWRRTHAPISGMSPDGELPEIVERPVGTELYVSDTTEKAIEEALPHARREYATYAEYPALRWQRDRFDELVANTLILGDPDLVIERIKGLQARGCNHLIFRPGWLGMPAEQVRRSLSLFAEHVMPAFR